MFTPIFQQTFSSLNLSVIAAMAMLLASLTPASAQTTIKVFAADGLQPAMAELSAAFSKVTGGKFKIEPVFGTTEALRQRLESGETADVFAAADIGEAKKLADAGKTRGPAVPFAKPKAGGPPFGFVVLKNAAPAAGELAGFLRFGPGRAVLEKFGFGTP